MVYSSILCKLSVFMQLLTQIQSHSSYFMKTLAWIWLTSQNWSFLMFILKKFTRTQNYLTQVPLVTKSMSDSSSPPLGLVGSSFSLLKGRTNVFFRICSLIMGAGVPDSYFFVNIFHPFFGTKNIQKCYETCNKWRGKSYLIISWCCDSKKIA